MSPPIEFEVVSTLAADYDDVWRVVSTMTGVNSELHPFVHMTSLREHQVLPTVVTPGHVVFRSWLLLFGVVPFDRHALALERVDNGRGFVEESQSWLQRRWRHERTLTNVPGGVCVVSDRLMIEPVYDPAVHLSRPSPSNHSHIVIGNWGRGSESIRAEALDQTMGRRTHSRPSDRLSGRLVKFEPASSASRTDSVYRRPPTAGSWVSRIADAGPTLST